MSHTHTRRPSLTVVPADDPAGQSGSTEHGASPDVPTKDELDSRTTDPGHLSSAGRAAIAGGAHVDVEQVRAATGALLGVLGVMDASGTKATEMAHAFLRLVVRDPLSVEAVPNEAGYQDLLVCRGIPFRALCDQHLMPISGVAHLGYVPGQLLLPTTGAADVVGYFAREPQSPLQLASQAARWIDRELQTLGVGVIVHADHSCDSALGADAVSATVSSSLLGQVRDCSLLRAHFMAIASSR